MGLFMASVGGINISEAAVALPSGMRVVVLDSSAETRATLRESISQCLGFVLAGHSSDWLTCSLLLDRFVPELLIADVATLPADYLASLSPSAFPILVGLQGQEDCNYGAGEVFTRLPARVTCEQACDLLERVRSEIYRRQADQFSALLDRYMTCASATGQYLVRLQVEDGNQTQEVPLAEVLFIAADGNYLRVHAGSRQYAMRETMTRLSARLDPARFVRVHRSFLVNLSHVVEVLARENSSTFVILSNGMKVPVGPNYRAEFDAVMGLRDRMSA